MNGGKRMTGTDQSDASRSVIEAKKKDAQPMNEKFAKLVRSFDPQEVVARFVAKKKKEGA